TVPLPVSYSDALVRASLENNRPVPIIASSGDGSNSINVSDFNTRVYVWLLDAYITKQPVMTFSWGRSDLCPYTNPIPSCAYSGIDTFPPITKVRSNWGLGGLWDGYSTSGIFDTSLTSTTGNNNPVDGYPNLRIVPELHPN
ncbi:MAG: hypothetical protein QM536_06805, partial [Chitinophagaceae bacterium]|nr:hypothetical protein [Chitinophagaceae bacterium]